MSRRRLCHFVLLMLGVLLLVDGSAAARGSGNICLSNSAAPVEYCEVIPTSTGGEQPQPGLPSAAGAPSTPGSGAVGGSGAGSGAVGTGTTAGTGRAAARRAGGAAGQRLLAQLPAPAARLPITSRTQVQASTLSLIWGLAAVVGVIAAGAVGGALLARRRPNA